MENLDMKYLDFVVTTVRAKMKLTKDQMKFAYTVGFIKMNMEPIDAAQMSLDLDTM
tara:strand:- start:36 stop:203 length:168 start_codon:yes stop_codon:yes gene_type:complete